MPEGHTIHRLARDHTRAFAGHELRVSSPQGRFDQGARTLDGRRLESIDAHGKHLFYRWEGARILHVHLGLYGKFRWRRAPFPDPRGAVRLRVLSDERGFDLNGPTACELLDESACAKITARLGQDPLRDDVDVEAAKQRILKSRGAIGRLLLDQSVIAGVGNVFRSEAMFLTGIHPERPGNALTEAEFDALWRSLTDMLRTGVRYNRIITTDPKVIGKPRSRMSAAERLNIYKKETCPRCGAHVSSWELGARTVHACLRCQPKRPKRTSRPAAA